MTPETSGRVEKREEVGDFAAKASTPLVALLFCRLRTWAIINEGARNRAP